MLTPCMTNCKYISGEDVLDSDNEDQVDDQEWEDIAEESDDDNDNDDESENMDHS